MKSMMGLLAILTVAGGVYGDADELFRQGAALFQSDPGKAYPLFVQAAEGGNVSAMVGVGHCLENGIGAEEDYAGAIIWYEKAVEQNNLKACERLAHIYASCPDPQFHNGERAVKYAETVVRKESRNPAALALLAAAHARNIEFEQAVQIIGKAINYEQGAKEKSMLHAREDNYRDGMPYPQIASQAWLLEASGKKSLWAIDQMVWRLSNRFGPLYNPEHAMRLCKRAVEAGESAFHVTMGNLYLDQEEVEKAVKCYTEFLANWSAGDRRRKSLPVEVKFLNFFKVGAEPAIEKAKVLTAWRAAYYVCGEKPDPNGSRRRDDRITINGKYYASLDELLEDHPIGDGYETRINALRNSERDCEYLFSFSAGRLNTDTSLEIRKNWAPPDMAGAEFLLKIAAAKGNREAKEMLSGMDAKRKKSRAILENKDGLDNALWATALSAQAGKYCNNDVFPINLRLAEMYLEKSYEVNPSSRTGYLLGCFYLRDHIFRSDFEDRPVDKAVRWLETAHSEGYKPATRRLIELYACDNEEQNCNAELALQYAKAYVEACPSDDYEAKRLLACAYARNKQFSDAVAIMVKIVEEAGKREYTYELKNLKKKNPVTIWRYANSKNGDSMLFAGWARTLD